MDSDDEGTGGKENGFGRTVGMGLIYGEVGDADRFIFKSIMTGSGRIGFITSSQECPVDQVGWAKGTLLCSSSV